MHLRTRLVPVWLLVLAATFQAHVRSDFSPRRNAQQAPLGPAEQVAEGVQLYRIADPSLLAPPGPVAVQALRLDPDEVTLEMFEGPRKVYRSRRCRRSPHVGRGPSLPSMPGSFRFRPAGRRTS